MPDYDRDRFGDGWGDLGGDCQDTRHEILIRDLVDEQLDAEGCTVLSGVLHDPCTGTTIEFRRGQATSDDRPRARNGSLSTGRSASFLQGEFGIPVP